MMTRIIFSILLYALFPFYINGQTSVITSEGFNNSLSLFSVATGSANWNYYNTPTIEGSHSFGTIFSSGNTTNTIVSNSIDLSNYANCSLSFRVAGDNLDNNDNLIVSISENGGNFTNITTLNGRATGGNNNTWNYTAIGTLSTAYPSPITQNSGNNTNGTSTIIISNLPNVSNLRIRIAVSKNNSNEAWYIDDFKIFYPTPSDVSITSTVSPAASGSCDQDYVSMSANGGEIANAIAYSESFDLGTNSKFVDESYNPIASNTSSAGGTAYEGSKSASAFLSSASFTVFPYNGSPVSFNTTSYSGDLTFQFKYAYSLGFLSSGGTIYLEVSTDGSSYSPLWSTSTTGVIPVSIIMPASTYAGKTNLYFRFRGDFPYAFYINASFSFDDIKITGTKKAPISWTPITDLYTDSTLTTPYTSGANIRTVYAKPDSGETTYTASTAGTPSKTVTHTAFQNSKVFTGTVNNDWANASNWSPSGIPTISKCVRIPSGKTANINTISAVNTNATSEYIRVFSGGTLNINSNNSLTIDNALKNENSSSSPNVVVESDANLKQNNSSTNTGSIIVKRKAKMKRLDYTYWSSPVSGQNLKNFSSNTLDPRFYVYNEGNDYFDGVFNYSSYPGFTVASAFPLQNKTTYNFETAKGYAIRVPNNYSTSEQTVDWTFTGVPNNGSQSIAVKKSTNGYNLVGNPYPSSIRFSSLKALNGFLNYPVYFWNNSYANPPQQQGSSYTQENYAILTASGGIKSTNGTQKPSDTISVGQGFIVAVNANANLVFNNSIRLAAKGQFFNMRKANSEVNRFWINFKTPANNNSEILIAYIEGATNDYDKDYDATLFTNTSDKIYSIQNDKELAIQGRSPNFTATDKISLGVAFFEPGNYEISIAQVEGIFNGSQAIYLRDKNLNTTVNLSERAYQFFANAGETKDRFEIVYKPDSTLGTDNISKNQETIIYENNGSIFIENKANKIAEIQIFDAGGRLLNISKPNDHKFSIEKSKFDKGLLIFKINLKDKATTKKFLLK